MLRVSVAALPLTVTLMGRPGIDQFQIVHAGPTTLRVRLLISAGADPEQVWRVAHEALGEFLDRCGLAGVELERAEEPPARSPGGKLRKFIPISSVAAESTPSAKGYERGGYGWNPLTASITASRSESSRP